MKAESDLPICYGNWTNCDKIKGCLYITGCYHYEEELAGLDGDHDD